MGGSASAYSTDKSKEVACLISWKEDSKEQLAAVSQALVAHVERNACLWVGARSGGKGSTYTNARAATGKMGLVRFRVLEEGYVPILKVDVMLRDRATSEMTLAAIDRFAGSLPVVSLGSLVGLRS